MSESRLQKALRLECEPDMLLPEGKHCDDCRYFERCVGLFCCAGPSEKCDYGPSRFEPVERL
jgi:hypothetical protein